MTVLRIKKYITSLKLLCSTLRLVFPSIPVYVKGEITRVVNIIFISERSFLSFMKSKQPKRKQHLKKEREEKKTLKDYFFGKTFKIAVTK